jgi:Carboxypeptidase regulatory-like domain
MATRTLVIPGLLLTLACGTNQNAPTSPSSTDASSTSLNTFTVRGYVTDGPFPLAGARVEVLEGIGSGRATTTDPDGAFELSGLAGVVQMRASLDGFQSHTRTVTIAANQEYVGFSLAPSSSADMTGEWRLTIEASATCQTLLEIARRRIYLATVAQDRSIATVRLSGAEFFELVDDRNEIRYNEFQGSVSQGSVKFLIDRYGPSGVIEHTGENSFVGITGVAEAIVTPTSTSGSLNGRISTYDGRLEPNRTTSSCTGEHRFTLERSTGGR